MRISLAALILVLAAGSAQAQKTDSVWIRNTDRITGEVKSLSRGLLEYSTDDLGTIYIEWDKVAQISTTTTLEVELTTGDKYYGPLGLATPGSLVLGGDTLPLGKIVAMAPIKQGLLDRMDGYLDLGFSYQKAHKTVQLTTGTRVVYRSPGTRTTFQLSTFLEDRDDAANTSRLTANLTEELLLGDHWSTGLGLGFERNDELDLAGRGRILGFGARTLVKTNHLDLRALGGLMVTRERYFSSDSTSIGFEGVIGVQFAAFRYDQPKLDASISSLATPSFTVAGRVRLQNDLRVSYELVKDFMLTVTLFDTYDSKPQSAGAQKNDFGTTLGISWTF